jgi:hypothetical protein
MSIIITGDLDPTDPYLNLKEEDHDNYHPTKYKEIRQKIKAVWTKV